MFDYSLLHWMTFFGAAVLLNISPGPDMAFIMSQAARRGRHAGFAAMFGVWTGALVHVVLAAVGLSAILLASADAFTVIKWIGGGYLIWLGIQSLRSDGGGMLGEKSSVGVSAGRIYRQGVMVAALNPKVAMFFLAFLPQFVVPGAGPVSVQLFLHGALIIVVAAMIEPWIVLGAAKAARVLAHNHQVGLWLDRSLGALLVMFGLRLVFSARE
ncbi:LysE family translocator [Salinisphaera sp. SWV1]|uniref:LysE family translocator n=1 Tax=Salinisphaera sp. SWV1 TaxID=3454139 RepID=UPI003F870EB3